MCEIQGVPFGTGLGVESYKLVSCFSFQASIQNCLSSAVCQLPDEWLEVVGNDGRCSIKIFLVLL